jgi:hypothetical protein
MWLNNIKVISTYSSHQSQNASAIISGQSGWKKIKNLSPDGVTNVYLTLNKAMNSNKTVDVYLESNEIERVVMY